MFKLCLHRNPLLLQRLFSFIIAVSLASKAYADMHVTTNGTHTGVLFRSVLPGAANALDSHEVSGGHDFIGSFTLAYGLWTMEGEPVHEFILTWEWQTPTVTLGRRGQHTITSTELNKYPDLTNSLYTLRPISMLLETTLQFYDAAGNRFATAEKLVNPGLLERAEAKPRFHAPGSPRWADFFKTRETEALPGNELDQRHKEVFLKAARVELTEPRIKSITWPESSLNRVIDEFCRREGIEPESKPNPLSPPLAALAPTNAAFAMTSSPSATPERLQTTLNPFEQAAMKAENPMERASRLQTDQHKQSQSP
jgi:hypothetical protein